VRERGKYGNVKKKRKMQKMRQKKNTQKQPLTVFIWIHMNNPILHFEIMLPNKGEG
jgi:hypothetical protein